MPYSLNFRDPNSATASFVVKNNVPCEKIVVERGQIWRRKKQIMKKKVIHLSTSRFQLSWYDMSLCIQFIYRSKHIISFTTTPTYFSTSDLNLWPLHFVALHCWIVGTDLNLSFSTGPLPLYIYIYIYEPLHQFFYISSKQFIWTHEIDGKKEIKNLNISVFD